MTTRVDPWPKPTLWARLWERWHGPVEVLPREEADAVEAHLEDLLRRLDVELDTLHLRRRVTDYD